MTILFFVIGALALVGAAVLLWIDRQRSSVQQHQRAAWGEQHDFKYRESDTKLRKVFHRATMNVPEHVEVRHVAYGHYDGAEAVVFDLVETATIIAVRRSFPSRVVVDLRHEDVLAPAEDDVELLGAMGPRVMFSNNLDVARRVCDRRMIALANTAPPYVEVLWNEGNWALGSLPLTDDAAILDDSLEVVRRFADLLQVLPPVQDPQDAPDPRDPHGPTRAELADEKTESMRDKQRRAAIEAAERRQGSVPSPASLPPQAVPRQGAPQPGVPPQGVPQQGVPQQGVSQRGAHEQGARPQRPTPIRQPIERPGRRRRESE